MTACMTTTTTTAYDDVQAQGHVCKYKGGGNGEWDRQQQGPGVCVVEGGEGVDAALQPDTTRAL